MNEYLSKWLRVIDEMKNSNTYKTAWGRGIVECIYLEEYIEFNNHIILNESDIALKMIKYYWNQTFFFGLVQGGNPYILQRVQEMIHKYKHEVSTHPVPWDVAESFFHQNESYLNKQTKTIITNANNMVCPRFLNVSNGDVMDLYSLDKSNRQLQFAIDSVKVIKDYAFVLSKLLNYKWAQLLERYNNDPKISSKVTAAAERQIKRQSLSKYRKLLLDYYHNEEIRDFYTGEIIDKNDIHIDHVIPWSFIYSDDIWNLVVTKSTSNLQKSNRPPTKEDIIRLENRNKELLLGLGRTNDQYKKEIDFSIQNNTLNKLYVNIKG